MFLWSANLQAESIFEKGGNTWVEKRKARKDKKIMMRMIAVELVMMVTMMMITMVMAMTMMTMTMIAAELATEV